MNTFKWTLITFAVLIKVATAIGAIQRKSIICYTPNAEKAFKIGADSIAYFEESSRAQGRSIASITEVRTKKTGPGFTKTLFFEGKRHQIHIDNLKQFSEVHDYVSITSPKGHEMTYPLICR